MAQVPIRGADEVWRILAGIGLMLLLAGGVDLALGIYPLQFGAPEWEFGAVGNLLNRLPLAGLGLMLLLAASLAEARAGWSLFWGAILLLVGILVFVLAVFVATSLPLILTAASGAARMPVLKAAAKIGAQTAVYFLGFSAVAVYAIRSSRRLGRRRPARP